MQQPQTEEKELTLHNTKKILLSAVDVSEYIYLLLCLFISLIISEMLQEKTLVLIGLDPTCGKNATLAKTCHII